MDNERLDFVREELYQLYFNLKNTKGKKKGIFQLPRLERVTDAFKAAAEVCIALDAVPEDFFNAQIVRIEVDYLKIADLCSNKAKENYRQYMDSKIVSLDRQYDLMMMYLKNQIVQAKRPVERALMDDDLQFTAWFRCCVTKEPIEEVLAKYEAEARESYSPRLEAFLKKKNLDYTRISK